MLDTFVEEMRRSLNLEVALEAPESAERVLDKQIVDSVLRHASHDEHCMAARPLIVAIVDEAASIGDKVFRRKHTEYDGAARDRHIEFVRVLLEPNRLAHRGPDAAPALFARVHPDGTLFGFLHVGQPLLKFKTKFPYEIRHQPDGAARAPIEFLRIETARAIDDILRT